MNTRSRTASAPSLAPVPTGPDLAAAASATTPTSPAPLGDASPLLQSPAPGGRSANNSESPSPLRLPALDELSADSSELEEPEGQHSAPPRRDPSGYRPPRGGSRAWGAREAPGSQRAQPSRAAWTIVAFSPGGAQLDAPDLGKALRKAINTSSGRGGVVMIADSRRTPAAAKWERFWRSGPASDLRWVAAHAPGLRTGPSRDKPEGTAPMGGVMCAAWGDFGERAMQIPDGIDEYGRYAALLVKGRGADQDVLFVSVYRAPEESLGGGSLVARIACATGASSAEAVHTAFGEDLLNKIAQWKTTLHCEIVIGGDWNHELTIEGAATRPQWKAGGEWLGRAGLADLRMGPAQRRATYSHGPRVNSVVDHIVATPRFAAEWNTGSQFTTVTLPGHEVGHRAIVSTSWTGCTKILGVKFTNLSVRQRGNLIARNQARRKRDVAALIHPAQGEDYREAVTDRLNRDTSIKKASAWLKYFASIGRTWWMHRQTDAPPPFFRCSRQYWCGH